MMMMINNEMMMVIMTLLGVEFIHKIKNDAETELEVNLRNSYDEDG